MTRKEKLIERLGNPQRDAGWTIAEVIKVLEISGFTLARIAGSHHVFRNARVAGSFVVPVHGNKVKPVYIQEIRERLFHEK